MGKIRLYYDNILNSPKNEIMLIKVNCEGTVLSDSIMDQISEDYPLVFNRYRKICKKYEDEHTALLGYAQLVEQNYRQFINIFGQGRYHKNKKDSVYMSSYPFFIFALRYIVDNYINMDKLHTNKKGKVTFAVPWLFGCSRGGMDFMVFYKILANSIGDDCNIHFYCHKKRNLPTEKELEMYFENLIIKY